MTVSIGQTLRRAVTLRSEHVAVRDGDKTFTWRETHDRIRKLAGALRKMGVQRGDRVALLAMNSHRSLEVFLAAIWAGGMISPVNHRFSVAEAQRQMDDATPRVLVVDDAFAGVAAQLIGPAIIGIEGAGDWPDYETLLDDADPIEDGGACDEDTAFLLYTGGTTGAPKGVMLTHANMIANTHNILHELPMGETTAHLHAGPLFHIAAAARMFSITHVGGTHVFAPGFILPDMLEVIERDRVAIATMAPTMLRRLIDHPDFTAHDLSSLKYISYGASPMPVALMREAMAKLPHVNFLQTYGMTETSPAVTVLSPQAHRDPQERYLRSAGRPVLTAEVRVVAPDGTEVPRGERGEVTVRGPMIMRGYWNRPDATAETVRDGWLRTGDVGYMDADGYLFIVDRIKDMIITGGENVYSQEVEDVLARHPAVALAAVIGLPDPDWGERVHAIVTLKDGASTTSDALIAHARETLAGFKTPKDVTIRTEPMPLSGANKILKTELKAELIAANP